MAVQINGQLYEDGTKHMYNPSTGSYVVVAPGQSTSGLTENRQDTYVDPNVNSMAHSGISQDNFSKWFANYSQTPESKSYGNTPMNYQSGNLVPVTQQAYTPQITQAQQQKNDLLAEIEKATAARKASRSAALKGVLDKTNSNLALEKGKVGTDYYDARNKESVSAQMRAKRIGEIMASNGYSEGYQGQAELANKVGYQGNIGLLKRQEQSAYDDIAKRGTDAQTEYNSGLAQAEADADTWQAEQRLAELGTLRNYAREDERNAVLDSRYNNETAYNRSRDTILDNRYNQEYADSRTDKQYDRNYQAGRDTVLDKRYNDETTYRQEQDRIDNEFRQGQFNWQKEQAELDRDWQKGQFDYQKARDLVSDERYKTEWKQKLDEWTFNKSKDQWMAQLQQNQFNYQKSRDTLLNQRYDKEWLQKMDEWAWSKSENNPQVKAQILENQIKDLQLENLPEELKLQLEQLRKEVAQIGVKKPVSQLEIDTQQTELDIKKQELQNLKDGKSKSGKVNTPSGGWTEQSIASYKQKAYNTIINDPYRTSTSAPTDQEISNLLTSWGVPLQATGGTTAPPLQW